MPDADAPIPQEILDALDATQKIKYRRRYNIHDWYWLADDGRVFTSARRLTVDESDASYQAFIGGAMATPWPRDDAGNQTDAALQQVFDMANFQPPLNIKVSSEKKTKK
jgi:hypothetical protein